MDPPNASPAHRGPAAIERMVRRGTLYARVALWVLGGLGALLVGIVAWQSGEAAATVGASIGLVIGGVPMWAPLYLHLRRVRDAVRAAATSGEALTGTVTDVSVYTVRGNPVTRLRFDLVSGGARFQGVLDLPGRREVPMACSLPVLFHRDHPVYCLASFGSDEPMAARLTRAEAVLGRRALRIALAVLLGAGLAALFLIASDP